MSIDFPAENEYVVTWSMPLEADGVVDAAQQALGIHRDPESIATVFFIEKDDRTWRVDLNADGSLADVVITNRKMEE